MQKLIANDPETRSANIVADNVGHLKALFPEAFTEDKIDFEVLKQLLGGEVADREEKYGLNWHGKHRARQLALTPSTGTLRPCPAESVDWDTTQNLMIEGDNLEVLKLLQKSYAGKVKLIYIDPPYNTGKDFVYPDDYRDTMQNYQKLTGQTDDDNRKLSSNTEASGRFHTDWLNMMYLRSLMGAPCFDHPKDENMLQEIVGMVTSKDDICLDCFAGSGTFYHSVMAQNALDGEKRRCLLVQLPECLDPSIREQKIAAEYCDSIGKPRTIAELTKERLRRTGSKIKEANPQFTGDLGFRVFKLDTSNIHAWEPDGDDLKQTLLDSIDHIKSDRSQDDILYELLLKLGLDLCVPVETQTIAGKAVRSIGAGTLIACLDEHIAREEVDSLALGIADWHKQLEPTGDATVIFRDSAFEDDVAKTNLAVILEQHGLGNVRSL